MHVFFDFPKSQVSGNLILFLRKKLFTQSAYEFAIWYLKPQVKVVLEIVQNQSMLVNVVLRLGTREISLCAKN